MTIRGVIKVGLSRRRVNCPTGETQTEHFTDRSVVVTDYGVGHPYKYGGKVEFRDAPIISEENVNPDGKMPERRTLNFREATFQVPMNGNVFVEGERVKMFLRHKES